MNALGSTQPRFEVGSTPRKAPKFCQISTITPISRKPAPIGATKERKVPSRSSGLRTKNPATANEVAVIRHSTPKPPTVPPQ